MVLAIAAGAAAYLLVGRPASERVEVQIDTATNGGSLSFLDRVEVIADREPSGGNAGEVRVDGTEVARFSVDQAVWIELDVEALAPLVRLTPVELTGVLSSAAEAAGLEDEFRRASSGGRLRILLDADTDVPEEHGLRGLWCAVTWAGGQPATGCDLPDGGSVALDGVTLTTSRSELAGESGLWFTPDGHKLEPAEVVRLVEAVRSGAGLAGGAGAGEPSASDTAPVDIDVAVDTAAADAARQHGVELAVLLEDAVARAVNALPPRVDRVAIEARTDPAGVHVIPGYGVGGVAGPFGVRILIDPDSPNLEQGLARLPSTVAHELHHVWRFNDGVAPHSGLLGVIVSEGLADRFAAEVHPDIAVAPWTSALPPDQIGDWYEQAVAAHEQLLDDIFRSEQGEQNATRSVVEAWLFGDQDIPRWAGYTLGYELAGDYLERNDTTAAQSFNTHWETVIDRAGPEWVRR